MDDYGRVYDVEGNLVQNMDEAELEELAFLNSYALQWASQWTRASWSTLAQEAQTYRSSFDWRDPDKL